MAGTPRLWKRVAAVKPPRFRFRIIPSRLVVLGVGTTMVVLCVAGMLLLVPGIRARENLADDLTAQLRALSTVWEQATPPQPTELDRALVKLSASVQAIPDLDAIAFIDIERGHLFRYDAEGERVEEALEEPEAWLALRQGRRRIMAETDRYRIYQPLPVPGREIGARLTVSREAFARTENQRNVSLIVGGMILSMLVGTLLMLRLARSLEESRGELELVVEATQEPLIMVDGAERVVFANKTARLLLNRGAADQLEGYPLPTLCPTPQTAAFFASVLKSEQPAVEELHTVLPGYTQEAVFRGMAVPVRTEVGRILGKLLVLRNVTLEKRLEDRKVSQTIHELKGMLGEATGFIRQVLNQPSRNDRAENEMYLNLSLEKLHHCYVTVGTMVRNIASAFMPEDVDLHLEHQDLTDLVRQNVEHFRAMMPADQAHAGVEFHAPDGLPTAYCDREAISRIMMNLLSNALQHCARGTITVSVADSGKFLEVVVEDDGAGIAPEHLPRIFEPHESFRSGGTGMGLSVCRDFVRAHGGQIWAESAGRGKGATFTFSLPKSRPAIISTDAGTAEHLRTRCSESGYHPVVIEDLLSVVKQLGEQHPNFVLLDIDLEGTLSGPSLAYRMKRSEIVGRVPLVAVAADVDTARAALGRYDGLEVDAFLTRDCNAASFASVVKIIAAYWYVSHTR